MRLGINIDHIATLREARKIHEPNPLEAVFMLKYAGAHQVTLHLREDRRHINEDDLSAIIKNSPLPVNVECALDPGVLDIIYALKPFSVTFVPEKRQEITTEGGLNLLEHAKNIEAVLKSFNAQGVRTSLFIDPLDSNISLAKTLGAQAIELHTGMYANFYLMAYTSLGKSRNKIPSLDLPVAILEEKLKEEVKKLKTCARLAKMHGLECFAGHGLNYENLAPILNISDISELNIGHSIIARAVFVGLERAVREMVVILQGK